MENFNLLDDNWSLTLNITDLCQEVNSPVC